MINVNYEIKKGKAALSVSGHAGFAPKGQDIVCAAVSGLCISLSDIIEREAQCSDFSYYARSSDGAFYIEAENFYKNLTALRIISYFTFAVNGLLSVERMHPDCITVRKGISSLGAENNDTSEQTMEKREKGGRVISGNSFLQCFSAPSSDDGTSQETAAGECAENEKGSENEEENASFRTADEEFGELIKGKYADAFRKRTQSIIDRRFSKMKGFEDTARACTPLLESLAEHFPDIDKNDTASLVSAFLEEKKSSASEKEKTESMSLIKSKIEEAVAKKAAEKAATRLKREAEEMKETYPDFDLPRELSSSPELKQLLRAGVSLKRAYETVNLENILMSSMRYAALQAGKAAADSVRQGRVQENSLTGNASSVNKKDVKNLTEKDIMKILSEVSRGAKISFR